MSERTKDLEIQLEALTMALDRIYGHSAWARRIVRQEFGNWARKRRAVASLLPRAFPGERRPEP